MLDLRDRTVGIRYDAPSPPLRGARFKRYGRLFAFSLVTCVAGAGLAIRSVHADAEKAALGLGYELGKLGDSDTARSIRINGQSVHVFASTEPLDVEEVLDQVESACREGSPTGGMFHGLSSAARAQLPIDPADARAAGVLREEDGDAGVVACVVREDSQTPGTAVMAARMQEFMHSGDLGAIGKLRYVFARAREGGKSHVIAAWTDGKFDVSALMSKNGQDTPGADSAYLSRPADSVRLLTADVEGIPYALRLYDAAGRPAEVLESYHASMVQNGWVPVPGDAQNARSFQRGPVDAMVMVQPNRDRTMVSLVEMRPR